MRRGPLIGVCLLLTCGARTTYVEAPGDVALEVTPDGASLTWKTGLNAVRTVVVRGPDSELLFKPTDGRVNEAIGMAVVVANESGTSFFDRGLPDTCGPFAWQLWSQASDGSWSKSPAIVRSERGAHTRPPSTEASGLQAAFEGNDLRLWWTNPEPSSVFAGVTVVRKRGSAPTRVTDGAVVYLGPSSMAVAPLTVLSATEETFFAVYACNGCGRCGDVAPVLAVTGPGVDAANLAVNDFRAVRSVDGRKVEFTWRSGAPRIRILRRDGAVPLSPRDAAAVVVFDGAASAGFEASAALLPDQPLDVHRYQYAAWGCVDDICASAPAVQPFRLTLTEALQGGGYTLFFSHASANVCSDADQLGGATTTSSPGWWKRCDATCGTATATQLTPGVADQEIAMVHSFFETKQIPVGRLRSSEFCRAVQTATGFGLDAGAPVQLTQLTRFVHDEAHRCADTTGLLNEPPPSGTNTVMVGHPTTSTPCGDVGSLNWGEAVIFKPSLGAPPRFIARVIPSAWASLP